MSGGSLQTTPGAPSNPSAGGSTEMLSYDWLFTTQAGVTFTYDLHGEVGSTVPYDQSITIPVNVVDMSHLLAYQFAGAGAIGVTLADGTTGIAPEPEVCLRLQSIVGPLLDQLSQVACDETPTGPFTVDGHVIKAGAALPSTVHSLQERFRNITDFTYGAGPGELAQIPQEAIAAVNYGGVTMAPLSEVVGCPCTASDEELMGVTGAPDSQRDALQSLFEQAAAAGMIQTSESDHGLTLGSTGGESYLTGDELTGSIYGASFSVGQKLAFYVQYNLKKTRNYEVVGLANVGGSNQTGSTGATATTVTYGGLEFTVPASQAETSDNYNVTWQIVLQASEQNV